MRVLQLIAPTGYYGAERWVVALGANIDRSRVRCDLAVTRENPDLSLEVIPKYRQTGHEVYEFNMRGAFDLSVIFRLSRHIREQGIQVIHTHGYKSDILGLLAAKHAGIASLSTPHGFGLPQEWKLKQYIRLGKYCLRYMDLAAPLSEQLYDELLEAKIPVEKLVYVQNGVDLKELEPYCQMAAEYRVAQSAHSIKRIGFVGQLIPRKNLEDMLRAFELVYEERPDTELIIVGDGSERTKLESMASRMSCAANIKFTGYRDDRLSIVSRLDLFAMTSRDEGIPRCLMEAMALRVPVAAYNIRGIDRLVRDGKNGLLTTFGDVPGLAECWLKILCERELSNALATAGRDTVETEFSGRTMADRYCQLYHSLVGA